MHNIDWQQFIPSKHTALWLFVGGIIIWKLTPFLRAMREACSEQSVDGVRGKVSLKRIIPIIFTLLVCYMIISNLHTPAAKFNETAFWGIIGYIALATSVITVTQGMGILDKVNQIKGNLLKSTEETNINTKKEETTQIT